MNKLRNEKGFALAEFVTALPLLILLICSLVQILIQALKFSEMQTADYVLKNEAQEILERITTDARAASSVTYAEVPGREIITFIFHASAQTFTAEIPDVLDTRSYIRYSKKSEATSEGLKPIYHIYAQRQNSITSPITGDNFLGDTSVEELKFSVREKNILHISLTIKSMVTERQLKINTSVFMPACEKIEGL